MEVFLVVEGIEGFDQESRAVEEVSDNLKEPSVRKNA